MKLPWKKAEELQREIDELEAELEELEEEKESWKKRFEAEKERRSELSRKKQEAEEKLNRLKDKQEEKDEEEEVEETEVEKRNLGFQQASRIIAKLGSISSPKKDLVTVHKSEKLSDEKALKNSVSRKSYRFIDSPGIYFLDDDLFRISIRTRPFYESNWGMGEKFETDKLVDFIESRKTWVVVSAGNSKIVKEKNGEVMDVIEVSSRVDRKQKKGGFSQKRFERKRQNQVEEHLELLEEKLEGEPLLVGEEKLCKKLSGRYLGGFDHNRGLLDGLYGFSLVQDAV